MELPSTCVLCGSGDCAEVADTDRDGRPLRTVVCTGCGLVRVDPRPSADAIRRFYSDDYRQQYKGSRRPKKKHCHREMRRAIERLHRLAPFHRPGARILDVGAGAGFFPYVLRENGALVDGIEPNRGYAGFAREQLGLDTVRAGFLEDCDRFGSYDIVTLHHVLEHLSDPLAALRHLHRLLKPEGRLIVEVPSIEASYRSPRKLFHIGHLFWFCDETLSALLAKAGFRVVDLRRVGATAHINVVAEAATAPVPADMPGPETAGRIAAFLASRRTLRHYLSPEPWQRILRKARQYAGEQWRVRAHGDELALIRAIRVPQVLER